MGKLTINISCRYGFLMLTCYMFREAAINVSLDTVDNGQLSRVSIKNVWQRRYFLHRVLIGLLLTVVFLLTPMVSYAEKPSDTQQHFINVPQLDAARALNLLAEQIDIVMLFPYKDAQTRQANKVAGYYTLRQALAILLSGTGLSGSISATGLVKISLTENDEQTIINTGKSSMNKQVKSPGLLATFISIFAAIGSSVTYAQGDNTTSMLEEVIVTASKRDSTVQDLPFSINAQTQKDIERSGATNLEELSRNVAGLTIQNLGPGQSQVAIRGVSAGQIVRDQPGVKEQVGIYVDESVISLSLFTPDLDMYDLNRLETLRGPQGTLFGSGSMGGTIRYITNQPNSEEFEGSAEASLGSVTDGEIGGHIKGMVNIPLANDTAALRIVGYTTQYSGFIDALGENGSKKEDVNGGDRFGFRAALRWDITDALTITPRIIMQNIEIDGFNRQEVFNLYANPYTTTRPAITLGEREQYLLLDEGFSDDLMIADITASLEFGSVIATFVSSYTDREIEVTRDASALTGSVSVDLGFSNAGIMLPSKLLDTTDLTQTTHELRFSSNSDSMFQWLAGTFFSDTERKYSQLLPTPGYDVATDLALGAGTAAATANGFGADSPYNAVLPYDLEQTAVFGEASLELDRLVLTLGGRYYDYKESRQFLSGGVFSNGDNRFDKTSSTGNTFRAMVSYEVSDMVTINGQASQGFRLGGVNDPLNAGLCNANDLAVFGSFQDYDDETLINYEAGIKLRTDRWSINAAAFYADISDLQVTLDAGSCSSRISFNVDEAHSSGFEIEATAQVTDSWYFTFAGTVLESEFDSTVRDSNNDVLGGVEKGNRLASVPETQFSIASTFTLPVHPFGADETYISASLQYIGDRITQPSDQVAGAGNFSSGLAFGGATGTEVTSVDLELDAYQTINLSAGLVFETWEAVLFANNVADENTNLGFDRERGGRARLGYATNQPRTIGVTLRKNF